MHSVMQQSRLQYNWWVQLQCPTGTGNIEFITAFSILLPCLVCHPLPSTHHSSLSVPFHRKHTVECPFCTASVAFNFISSLNICSSTAIVCHCLATLLQCQSDLTAINFRFLLIGLKLIHCISTIQRNPVYKLIVFKKLTLLVCNAESNLY